MFYYCQANSGNKPNSKLTLMSVHSPQVYIPPHYVWLKTGMMSLEGKSVAGTYNLLRLLPTYHISIDFS